MKSITIHKLDQELYQKLLDISQLQNTSINKLVKRLLRNSLGLTEKPTKKRDLSFLTGTWSEKEAKEFDDAIAFFDNVSMTTQYEKD